MASNVWVCDECSNSNSQRDKRCCACGESKWQSGPKKKPDARRGGNRGAGDGGGRRRRRQSYDDSFDFDFDDNDDEVRIVLLGKTGSGKSATGNIILGEDKFSSKLSAASVTHKCIRRSAERFGKTIHVVDTPGIFDTSAPNDVIQKEIAKCVGITSPGPHAFLLVLGLQRFTQEEEDSVNHFIDCFGEDVFNYMIPLFTRKDDLIYEDKTIEDHLRTVPSSLKSILKKCGNRRIAFNNRGSRRECDNQVEELLDMINDNIRQNNGQYYTSEMYESAEDVMRAREVEIKREREREKTRERREIESEMEKKYKRVISSHRNNLEDVESRVAELESLIDHRRSRADVIGDDIKKYSQTIEREKRKTGNVNSGLKKKVDELEKEFDDLRGKKENSMLQDELDSLRSELVKMRKQSARYQREKERETQDLLEQQQRRFDELERSREVARKEVEEGTNQNGDAMIQGIIGLGKLIWKGIQKIFF